jgi:hypothetical protein
MKRASEVLEATLLIYEYHISQFVCSDTSLDATDIRLHVSGSLVVL